MKVVIFLFVLLELGFAGVLRKEEDQPIAQSGVDCGDSKCPMGQRCEIPSPLSDCEEENGCPITPRCVTIPIPAPKCSGNEEMKACGSACEPTCQNMEPQCGLQCLTNVCQCKDGFFRDLVTKKCVKQDRCANCSLECPENEKCEFVDLSCDGSDGCKRTEVCTTPVSHA